MERLGDPADLDVLITAKLIDYGIDTSDLEPKAHDLPGPEVIMSLGTLRRV